MATEMRSGHGGHGDQGHAHAEAHAHDNRRVHGSVVDEENVATGTIASIAGSTFVLTTKAGEVTVATDTGTNFHTPGVAPAAKQAGYDGYANLSLEVLKVGQRVGVMGERRADGTLLAQRVHIPTP